MLGIGEKNQGNTLSIYFKLVILLLDTLPSESLGKMSFQLSKNK